MKWIFILCGIVFLTNSITGSILRTKDKRNKSENELLREFVFTTDRLPADEKSMCSIGNGHIATHVFSESLYMNGLYNGVKGESHRARIPAWNNIRILNETLEEAHQSPPSYSLDTLHSAFFVRFKTEKAEVVQRMYAHRFYTRAIVNQFVIKSTGGESKIKIGLFSGPKSDDVDFESPTSSEIEGRTVWKSCGVTFLIEDSKYQTEKSKVCAYWTDVPSELIVEDGKTALHTFVMTADTSDAVALKEMQEILKMNGDELFEKHITEWHKHVDNGLYGNIYGNEYLSKVVNAVWYYLLTSLPSLNSNQPARPFYGLSPGGLSRGSHLQDYQGHSFWDTEVWMYPYILMIHPKMAKDLLDYRTRNLASAMDLAAQSNHKGIRFPWESGFTGTEVTPDCCPEVANYQHHITGCIAFAIRQYIAMTGDQEWLNKDGCDAIKKISEFWQSRVEFNDVTGFYDIKNAMGPDEDHPNITNSVFTNVIAGLSLYLGDYASCLCGETQTTSGADIAKKIALPYDVDLDYHPQYEGYERPTIIKQADAVLLGFPLLYKMDASTRKNDLLYYENVTRENGPAMTWSMHTVGHLRLGNDDQAEKHFFRSFQPYVREPYYIWTEAREPDIGAVNFITGMGGFMQSIVFGYAGISIYLDRIEIAKPQLIPNTTGMDVKGIKYLGADMSLSIRSTQITFTVNSMDSDRELILKQGDEVTKLTEGFTTTLKGEEIYEIRSSVPNSCPLPLDLIGQIEVRTTKSKLN